MRPEGGKEGNWGKGADLLGGNKRFRQKKGKIMRKTLAPGLREPSSVHGKLSQGIEGSAFLNGGTKRKDTGNDIRYLVTEFPKGA